MTRSIREILASVPNQERAALDDHNLARYLREHVDKGGSVGPARDRQNRHAIRDAFYRDGGCDVMKRVVDEHFLHPQVNAWRSSWIKHARFSNPVKRIVTDVSTVYDEPSRRTVGGTDANEATYRELVDSLMLDEQMAEINRLVNLHRVVLVGPRVRQNPDDTWSMVLDIATPAVFRPVLHPTDGTLVVGWLVACESRIRPDEITIRKAAWELWTDHELIYLDENFAPIGSDVPHGLGANRWIPMSFLAVSLPGFWPGEEGEDLVAAAVAIWFAGILLMKETQAATKITTQAGDVGNAPRDQPLDTGVVNQVPDGVVQTTTDMSMDTSLFIAAADHILERVANGYGMSLAQIKHQGVQSADAREAMLEPLRALRRRQIKHARRWEKRLAELMSRVGKASKVPSLSFDVVQWRQDFGEIQAVVPFKQRMEEHIQARQIGVDSRVAFMRRENPDIDTDEMAAGLIARNFEMEAEAVAAMKNLLAISGGSVSGPVPEAAQAEAGDTPHAEARPGEAARAAA